jgi:hypothetical protein
VSLAAGLLVDSGDAYTTQAARPGDRLGGLLFWDLLRTFIAINGAGARRGRLLCRQWGEVEMRISLRKALSALATLGLVAGLLLAPLAGEVTQARADTSPGTVTGWGSDYVLYDDGDSVYSRYSGQATPPAGLAGVNAIAANGWHSLALKSNGKVVAWGLNDRGQTKVPSSLSGVTAIAAGLEHNLALKTDGKVVAWGNNKYGQTKVPSSLSKVTAIAAGSWHNLALKSDGKVVAWGENGVGQAKVPSNLSNVTAIAAGGGHSLALKKDGKVVGWGYDEEGQIDIPAELNAANVKVTAIAVGFDHNLALTDAGKVVAWGVNDDGQTNVPAAAQSGVKAIAAGMFHSLALKDDGTIVGWGHNASNQITAPAGTANVNALVAGCEHSLALVDGVDLEFFKVGTPTISGTAKVGSTLKAATGTWSPNTQVTYSYQWFRGGAEIPDATAATYTLTPDDANALIQVKVKAAKAGYIDTWSALSKASKKVALGSFKTTTPLVKNQAGKDASKTAPVFGDTLSVTSAAWSPDVVLEYQWFRSGTKVAVHTGESYTVQAADVGKTLVVKATGQSTGYTKTTKASKTSKKIVAAKQSAVTPKIIGEPALGATLEVDITGWTPADDEGFTYQWLRDGKNIKKATNAEYTTDEKADKGKSISVKVTRKLPGYTTVTKTSAKLKIGVLTTATPKLVNTTTNRDPVKYAPKVGDILSVNKGGWGPGDVELEVEWYLSGIKTAISQDDTYTLTSADIGKTIKVKVIGTKPGFTQTSKTSAASKKISKA